MDKMYMITTKGIEEIEILKETEKQYKISGGGRNTLNKSDIGKNLSAFRNRFKIFGFDEKELIMKAKIFMLCLIEAEARSLENSKSILNRLENM